MKKDDFINRYRAEMADVHVSPQLKRQTLDALAGKENPVIKKKLSAAFVLMIAVFLIGAVAAAAVSRAGIVDFARFVNSYVPEDAQEYVQTDVMTAENEMVTVALRELYYDGYIARLTVDVTPKDPTLMLLGMDMSPEDNWQNMTRLNGEWDENNTKTALDVFREGGYRTVYSVNCHLWPANGESAGSSGDYNLSEDGILTAFDQTEFGQPLPEREATLRVYLTPHGQPYTDAVYQWPDDQIVLELPVTLKQADYANETYVSTEPAEYPSVGVRVDEIRMEVRAQEIHASIDYTVTDRETYDALDYGLWFEFIDPQSTAEQPYDQRLKGGMSGMGSTGPTDGTDPNTAVHFRQSETLGRNELHDTYTLRAYDAWEKDRFEEHTFVMQKVD